MSKLFSLSRISREEAVPWIREAISLKAKKIIVGLTGRHLKPHYLLPGEDEDEKVKTVTEASDYFCGVIPVKEAKEALCL